MLIQKYNQLAKSRIELFQRENADAGSGSSMLKERRNSATNALEISKLTAAVGKDLPRVLAKLVQAVKASEAAPVTLQDGRQVRRPFMYKGERYLAVLDRLEKVRRERGSAYCESLSLERSSFRSLLTLF